MLLDNRKEHCTATANSGHSHNQDFGILTISLKGVSDGETEETSPQVSGPRLFLKHSEEVHLNDYENIHEARARIGHFYHTSVLPETPAFGVRETI